METITAGSSAFWADNQLPFSSAAATTANEKIAFLKNDLTIFLPIQFDVNKIRVICEKSFWATLLPGRRSPGFKKEITGLQNSSFEARGIFG